MPAGTPFLAGHNLIGSANWADHKYRYQHLGEVEGAARPWRDGARPWEADLGQPAGNPVYFKEGAPISAAGEMPVDSIGAPVSCNAFLPMADLHTYRQVSIGGVGPLYPSGIITGNAEDTPALANTLFLTAYINVLRQKVSEIGVWLNSADALGKIRMCIYKATSRTDLTPHNLVWQSAEIATPLSPESWRMAPVDVELEANTLYWFGYVCNSNLIFARGTNDVFMFPILGITDYDFAQLFGYREPFTFGPLPDPAPTLTPKNGSFVIPCVRLETP